jgi:glycosyltransferase involved in cell wall biosynthesis
MSSKPSVSVVIPTYNQADFLRQALQSVQDQTYTDWEVIVVDNMSDDNTRDMVDSIGELRFRSILCEIRGNIAAARNMGIKESKGDYIAFLDSDDLWYPGKLEHCLNVLSLGANLVCHGEIHFRDDGFERKVTYGPEKNTEYETLLFRGNCLSTSAIVVQKDLVEKVGAFDETQEMVTAEDYDLWLKCAQAGGKFAFIDDIFGKYRLHQNNSSAAATHHMSAALAVLEKHFTNIPIPSLWQNLRYRHRKSRVMAMAARRLQTQGATRVAFELLLQSLLFFPIQAKAYLIMGAFLFHLRKTSNGV